MSYSRQSNIDKPQCPNGHGDMELKKQWELKGKGKAGHEPSGVIIELWKCPQCGISMRMPTGRIRAKKRPKGATKQ